MSYGHVLCGGPPAPEPGIGPLINAPDGMELNRGPRARKCSQPACARLTENHEGQSKECGAGLSVLWGPAPVIAIAPAVSRGGEEAWSPPRPLHSLCPLPGSAALPLGL